MEHAVVAFLGKEADCRDERVRTRRLQSCAKGFIELRQRNSLSATVPTTWMKKSWRSCAVCILTKSLTSWTQVKKKQEPDLV